MKRLTVVFLVTLVACVAAASSAQAAPPTHERVPVDQSCWTSRAASSSGPT